MPSTVQRVLQPALSALGIKRRRQFLDRLVEFVRPDVGGDSDPNSGTIRSYANPAQTRCNYKFAGMVLDFLHVHRADVKDERQLALARRRCRAVLAEHDDQRFENPARSNAASLRRIDEIAGVYVLYRRATTDQVVRQELLVLSHSGRGGNKSYVTYISPEVICRGTWSVLQQSVCCMTHGFRGNYRRRDVATLHLLSEPPSTSNNPTFLSGFVAGVTSGGLRPATVAVVGIKVPPKEVSKDLLQIGNLADAEIRAAWALVADRKSSHVERIGAILDGAMQQKAGVIRMEDSHITGEIVKACSTPPPLISAEVAAFCRTYRFQDGWRSTATPEQPELDLVPP
jgi:hypothetical protein